VSERAELFLGVIAVATLAIAIMQIGVLVAAGLLARRVQRLVVRAEEEFKPLIEHLNNIGRDASRAASLATAQVERADRVFADLSQRIDETLTIIQSAVRGPMREGFAVLSAIRAAIGVVRDIRAGRARSRAEDEDALFI
jgi:hypothetical protein